MRFLLRLRIIIPLLCLMATLAQADGKKTQLFPDLSPGLNIYRYDWDLETCVIYVAEMSRQNPTLHFEVALANSQVLGKETVRSIAKRRTQRGDRNVVVAVNGGFGVLGDMRGYGGVLENLHIQDGELITQPTDTDACFGVTESGEFLSTSVQMKANIQIGTHTLEIGCINQRRLDGCKVTLYTPRLGESTHTNRRRGKEVILSGLPLPLTPNYAHPYQVKTVSNNGNSTIPKDGAILWINAQEKDPSISQLNPGASGKLTVTLSPPEWNQVCHAVGGRLRLLKNGKINQMLVDKHLENKKRHAPGKRSQELNLSHEPRTALGYNADTLFLVVADGRQPKYSTGLTLYELASILIELGATEAINLDGGSSSTFVVNDEVINQPSGQQEREVLNAVFITKDVE
jgi:hypothetical protein